MLRRRLINCTAGALIVAMSLLAAVRISAAQSAPFAVAASVGPNASSRIDATVTRIVNGTPVTLPAAIVPALAPGDVVDVQFGDYLRPPARANYHVNVAFITEVAPQRWLYDRSGPWDRLFSTNNRRRRPAHPADLRFTYGEGDHRGIPLFLIVPEDGKTRGMDGVRDYVAAHATDFKNMSQSANDAVARYSWFRDFLQSLGQGALDPVSSRQRIVSVASSLGASPGAVDACYSSGGTQAEVANCIQSALVSVQYQTNINAPTTAQFFGGVAGAAAPVQLAFYLQPLLAMWQIFARIGHQEYEYLPAALNLTAPKPGERFGDQFLMGAKVPSLRPPAAQSSVLFFTIGDAQAAQNPPHVTSDAPATGVCARTDRVALPLHLDRTSPYVNDAAIVATPDRGQPVTIPLDPRSAAAPVVPRAQLDPSGAGETVRVTGRFGFDPLPQQNAVFARIAIPHPAAWSIAAGPHRPPISGGTLDVIATSTEAPCLTGAELEIGDAPPVQLNMTRLDDRRVELQASLQNMPPGDAQIRLYQDDPMHRTRIEDATSIAIMHSPPRVGTQAPVVDLGDSVISLQGAGFESVAAVRLGASTYVKDPASTSNAACFAGPPLANGLEPGETVSAQLLGPHDTPGQVFTLTLAPRRPTLQQPTVVPDAPSHLSTDALRIALRTANGTLPAHAQIRLRHARPSSTPCDALREDAASALVSDAATHEVTASELDAVLRAGDDLGDGAFGTLQVQLVDADAKTVSAWRDLPGNFVRAPSVRRIDCPADPAAPCTLLGTGLDAIDGIEDAPGHFVAPNVDCVTTEKGFTCVGVPHRDHYTLRLGDSQTMLALPDALIAHPGAATPAPKPSS